MTGARSLLEAENKKLSKQIEKLRTQLEAAETRFQENDTAIRVLSRIETDDAPTVEDKASSQEQVLKVIPVKESQALTPRQIHHWLEEANAGISPDNVRTILSRLNKAKSVETKDGRYWRAPPPAPPSQQSNGGDDFDVEELIGGRPAQPAAFDDDLDSDIPF